MGSIFNSNGGAIAGQFKWLGKHTFNNNVYFKGIVDFTNSTPIGITTDASKLIIEVVASENLPIYRLITTDGYLADSNNIFHRVKIAGITLEAINTGFSGKVLVSGEVINNSWNFTPNSDVFLNGTNLSNTVPSTGFSINLGVTKNANTLILNIKNSILLG